MARKILLADDSVTAQNMGRKILADAGYEVITVNNGSAALKKIVEVRPDLVVLDVYMPGYSGLEVCQRLKESPDTAHLPVLLSVGKLEPFKPEEAQRVRAEGFIVKPFEATELLSMLAKLEDKVVPRTDGVKPGRFGRAVARVEESGRKPEPESSNQEKGWRERIGFPSKKKEDAELSPDDGALYNQVNRDLRTVVDRRASDTAANNLHSAASAGVDGDATPEEMAALAAAAGKLRPITSSALAPLEQAAPAQRNNSGNFNDNDKREQSTWNPAETPLATRIAESAAPVVANASAEFKEEAVVVSAPALSFHSDVQAAINTLTPDALTPVQSENQSVEEDAPPATMAAAGETSSRESRWTAVAVAPSAEEAGLSLVHEMEKAAASISDASVLQPDGQTPTAVESVSEVPTPAVESPQLSAPIETLPEPPAVIAENVSTTAEAPMQEPSSAFHETLPAEVAPSEPTPSEPTVVAVAQESNADRVEPAHHQSSSELPQPEPIEAPVAHQQEAALAVAAGAERMMEEVQIASPAADSASIASIVESVMAELRPKLVEEITRKLAAERK